MWQHSIQCVYSEWTIVRKLVKLVELKKPKRAVRLFLDESAVKNKNERRYTRYTEKQIPLYFIVGKKAIMTYS